MRRASAGTDAVRLESRDLGLGRDLLGSRVGYARLEQYGPIGTIASNLCHAQRSSERAKVYRGGRYRGLAYWDGASGQNADRILRRIGWLLDRRAHVVRDAANIA
jgi:hypothetical protein